MIEHDFIIYQLTELLCASDLVRLSITCQYCHEYINKTINKIINHDRPIHLGRFQTSVTHSIGNTSVRIPIITNGLLQMRQMLSMDRTALMTKVQYFYIYIEYQYQSKTVITTETLYEGPYIPAYPKTPELSLLDVCNIYGEWLPAVFIKRDGDDFIIRYKGDYKNIRIHHLSPRISPPYRQICSE